LNYFDFKILVLENTPIEELVESTSLNETENKLKSMMKIMSTDHRSNMIRTTAEETFEVFF